jgi:hypothetical protein
MRGSAGEIVFDSDERSELDEVRAELAHRLDVEQRGQARCRTTL